VIGLLGAKGKVLNGELIRAGHGWVNTSKCRAMVCRMWLQEQKKAKEERKGLWQKKDAQAPWLWNATKLPMLEGGKKTNQLQEKLWLPMEEGVF
ncbi:MAG: hypothetical protein IK079_06590, partial [Desulfovibrio sp.]|nr:hypothetical protein [Desulfovibrio sp.]